MVSLSRIYGLTYEKHDFVCIHSVGGIAYVQVGCPLRTCRWIWSTGGESGTWYICHMTYISCYMYRWPIYDFTTLACEIIIASLMFVVRIYPMKLMDERELLEQPKRTCKENFVKSTIWLNIKHLKFTISVYELL